MQISSDGSKTGIQIWLGTICNMHGIAVKKSRTLIVWLLLKSLTNRNCEQPMQSSAFMRRPQKFAPRLQSKCQNHKEDGANFWCLFKKAEL